MHARLVDRHVYHRRGGVRGDRVKPAALAERSGAQPVERWPPHKVPKRAGRRARRYYVAVRRCDKHGRAGISVLPAQVDHRRAYLRIPHVKVIVAPVAGHVPRCHVKGPLDGAGLVQHAGSFRAGQLDYRAALDRLYHRVRDRHLYGVAAARKLQEPLVGPGGRALWHLDGRGDLGRPAGWHLDLPVRPDCIPRRVSVKRGRKLVVERVRVAAGSPRPVREPLGDRVHADHRHARERGCGVAQAQLLHGPPRAPARDHGQLVLIRAPVLVVIVPVIYVHRGDRQVVCVYFRFGIHELIHGETDVEHHHAGIFGYPKRLVK